LASQLELCIVSERNRIWQVVKRNHLRDELFDPQSQRIVSEKLWLIGRMVAPHWYCRTRDRFQMIRPD